MPPAFETSTADPHEQRELRNGLVRSWLLSVTIGTLVLAGLMTLVYFDRSRHKMEQQRVALSMADTQASLITERLDSALSATYALAAVLRQYNYRPDYAWMEPFARELLRYHPGTANLQFSPDGITQYIVPLAGNEKAIGNNLLVKNDRNKEALLAVATRKLTLAGPFELRQGGIGLVGRLPIFKGSGDSDAFWGFAVALMHVDAMLKSADIDRLVRSGYDYTLWREHPDTGKPHVFSKSAGEVLDDAITHSFQVLNGTWHLSVAPRAGWMAGTEREFGMKLMAALLFSFLAGFFSFAVLRQPVFLRAEVSRRTAELTNANVRLAQENRERAAAEASLRLSDDVIAATAEGIMITDAQHKIVRVNRSLTQMTGYAESELIGQSPTILNSGRHDESFFADMFHALETTGSWQGEIWNRRKNGEIFPQWLGISALSDAQGTVTHYVSIGTDISERKQAEEQIHFLANYDALTGLPNRILLHDRFKHAVTMAERTHTGFALVALDIDRFKIINESLGHRVGDELLCQVVERLHTALRTSDTISRQSGDEFLIISQDHESARSIETVARHIQQSLAKPFRMNEQDISVSVSIGIALFPDDGHDFDTLSKKCDIAMHHAKENGGATHRFFTDELNTNSADRLRLETELRNALEQGEFVLHYQPQVAIDSGRVIGAEALVRWQHPEQGMVPPGRFIPLAEETGLIVPLDKWVLNEACRQAAAWVKEGLPVMNISVNLSGLQFRQSDLVEQVRTVLEATGHPAAHLELELTESVLIHDVDKVLVTIAQLKALGVRLAIDDFGTGYSSLAYLKRFSVDKLKIDQSFVRGTSAEDAAIVSAVIQLGNSLNLKTIAEGAETADQIRNLQDKGCCEVQGYYFSKPLPAAEFSAFVRKSLGLTDSL